MPASIRLLHTLIFLALLPAVGCAQAPVYGYTVIARLPHSTSSYTEGLFFLNRPLL